MQTSVTISGGSLSGTGAINGSVFLENDAAFAPGNSPGTLFIVGDLNIGDGVTIQLELDDIIDVTGNVTIAPGAFVEILLGATLPDSPSLAAGIDVASFFTSSFAFPVPTTNISVFADTFNPGAQVTVLFDGGVVATPEVLSSDLASPVNVLDDVIAVPEPGTLALFGFGLTGLGLTVWRRRRVAG